LSDALEDPSENFKIKPYTDAIKSLRELGRQLTETEVLSKKDVLSFDGPKFKYVFVEIVSIFRSAMKEAGTEEAQANSIMKHFRDLFAGKEVELRRETEKIDSRS
jgi:hypothetical protein